jgi:transcriptional regulator with XRE-family HTH domain
MFMTCIETIGAMELHERLKKWREAYKMNQEAIAMTLGIARSTYANWEGGAPIPEKHMNMLLKLGFNPEVDEPEVLRPLATIRQLRFIINVLASPSLSKEEREDAKNELLAALGLDY